MHAAFGESSRPLPGSTEAIVADIIAMEKERQRLQDRINEKWNPLLKLRMADAYEIIASIGHRETPGFGQTFLNILHESGCKVQADPSLAKETLASYGAYHTSNGFINTMGINPLRLIDLEKFQLQHVLILCSSILHEGGHVGQNYCAPVMRHSPYNPTTNVILHPVSWMQVAVVSEKDAYRVQGMGTALLADKYPAIRELTEYDLVSAADFEATKNMYPNMLDRAVCTALMSLSKIKNSQYMTTFEHGYQRSALEEYQRVIETRIGNCETKRIYIRADDQDLWQIGNHGIGPNSFGHNVMEPLFFQEPKLLDQDRFLLDQICKKYGIPPLEDCKTLQEYYQPLEPTPEPNNSQSWASSALNGLRRAVGMGSESTRNPTFA